MPAPVEFGHLRVVLVSSRNPLNIGAAARALSNFGFLNLRLVNPYAVAFQNARSAVGPAAELLAHAREYGTVAEAVADCTLVVGTTAVGHRELQHPLRMLKEGARLIRRQMGRDNVALLFGSEKFGLSNEDLSHCHWVMRIPTREEHISMNLGQAVAVCAYELARGARVSGLTGKRKAARAAEVERFTALLMEALHKSGYVKPRTEAGTEEKVRRLVRRMDLRAADMEMWLGIVRQILWRVGRPQK